MKVFQSGVHLYWIHGPLKMPYTTWTLLISTKHAPHRPVSVYWKFQYLFSKFDTKLDCTSLLEIASKKLLHKKTALKLAWWRYRVETHNISLWDVYLPFKWRASPQCCQIALYAGSLITLFTDLVWSVVTCKVSTHMVAMQSCEVQTAVLWFSVPCECVMVLSSPLFWELAYSLLKFHCKFGGNNIKWENIFFWNMHWIICQED